MKLLLRCVWSCVGAFVLGILPFASNWSPHVFGQNLSNIPEEYFPNYHIREERQEILDQFVKIQAVKNTGLDLDEQFFQELGSNFEQVFPHLPQESKYKVIYEQCRILTQNLAQDYSFTKFGQFIDGCFNPLDKSIKEMSSRYTVQAAIRTNPESGSAPLTVTFDARDSKDPSNDTIPANNYFRYFKDTDGVDQILGQGPVVNYTFRREGNYVVHLTVRSANQETEGVLDGSQSTTINVGPESANIIIYANGQRLEENGFIKIGTAEAQEGVYLDASATVPKGGRVIQSHERDIKGGNNSIFRQTNSGSPDAVQVQFPDEGQFQVTLSTLDNENNTVKKTYNIVIADPLAIIRQQPENGNTSTTFTFDAASSYSLVSKIRLYTREVFDPDGERIDTIQGKKISKKFSQPGSYAIRLTVEDEQGRINAETLSLFVESTEPVPQFSVNPMQDREHPSQFELDASLSNDIDILGADDSLDYRWDFSPLEYATVNDIVDDGRKVVVTFEEKGVYDVKLTVSDQYGKLSEITKQIDVESSLRPLLFISPIAGFRGTNTKFLVKANKPIVSYDRNLGDGTTRSTLDNKLVYSYDSVGVYPVTLTVYGEDDEQNSITRNVYVGETGKPIIAYQVKSRSDIILKQEDSCIIDEEEIPAYRIARLQNMTIDVGDSVNTKGEKSNLQYYFQPQSDDIYKSNRFSYKFVELGCQYVDVTIEDTQISAVNTERIWFKIVNDLPTLQNIQMTFPQYGNQVGVGLNENQQKDVFQSTNHDPLIIQVFANNVRDPDGAIAFYKRYYFNKDNPGRILETKITPANVPEAYFSLQKIPGEYEFGVTLVDNDGGEQRSDNIIGNGPIVFFPPDSTNIDIPIVTLRQSEVNARVGDDIEFETIARILSDRDDFAVNRSIKYDFDGDGEIDLTTKDSKVTHFYRQAGEYIPRVKVVYRGIPGTAVGEKIIVDDGIRPLLVLENLGPLVIARDISLGTNIQTEVCMDASKCGRSLAEEDRDLSLVIELTGDNKTFDFVYQETGNYVYEMYVVDDFANEAIKTGEILIEDYSGTGDIELLSIPKAQLLNNSFTITVGRNLNNTIDYFIANPLGGECFFDTDVTIDSDGDENPEQDRDILCDELVTQEYQPIFDSQIGRIYYQKGEQLATMDVTVTFLDSVVGLDEKLIPIYRDITSLILSLDATDPDIQYLKDLLAQLRNQLGDSVGVAAQVVALRDHVSNIETKLTEKEINRLDIILYALTDSTITAALGGTPYEQARQDILLLVPTTLKSQIEPLFQAIDNADGDQDVIKTQLQTLVDIVRDNAGPAENQIDPLDIDLIIMPKICQILEYFEIDSEACQTQDELDGIPSGPDADSDESGDENGGSVLGKVLRIILIIILVLGVIFGILVAIFAIKAKQEQAGDGGGTEGGDSQ